MAEAFVRPLTDKLISVLAEKLLQEVYIVTGFRDDFQWMCDELNSIKSMLDDAREKRKQSNSSSLTNWLHKFQEFLDDAVDIMDDCEVRKFRNPVFRIRMGRKIKMLKERLTKIHKSAKYLNYVTTLDVMNPRTEAFSAYSEDLRKKSSAFLEESILTVGMKEVIEKIEQWILLDGLSVIAIVGNGGMGKTHLLQNVFERKRVQESFDHLVWLAVSQKFLVDQLLLEMGNQIKLPDNQMNFADFSVEAQRRERICTHLKGKRVLFVLDDVWNTDILDQIRLPRDHKTKIVVTTRYNRVADTMGANHTHRMGHLNENNSWKLFCMHAFAGRDPPNELKTVAREIVKKCYGLPLAVKTIGAYMARVNRLPNEWESTLLHLNVEAHMNDQVMLASHGVNVEADMYGQVMPTLRVSYEALPDHLKPCFLYCSAFPRNTQIDCDYLVHAWIAEGFISAHSEVGGGRYDIGRSYLKDLIDRCVIEVSQVGGDGRVMYCKMHDLLYDLALSESHKVTRCLLSPGKELQEFPVDKCQGVRRISLMKNNISTIKGNIQAPKLRSLLLWNNIHLTSISASFINKLRHLTVLDLSQSSIEFIAQVYWKYKIILKLLNLSGTKIKKLPKSLSGLRSLQFLDVSRCNHLQRLHPGIGKHKLMLHLNVQGCKKLEPLPAAISKVDYLLTLKGVIFKMDRELKAVNKGSLQWTDLKYLTHLENLSIAFFISHSPMELESESEQGINLNDGTFGVMTKMRSLVLENSNSNIDNGDNISCLLHLPNDMKDLKHLEVLHLRNCVLPRWIIHLQNLMVLVLDGDNSASADYRGIERIPNLVELTISHNKRCIEFPEEFGKREAFSNLKKLSIEDFDRFENFPSFEEGAMPMLKFLRVKNCNRLKDIHERGSLRWLERLYGLYIAERRSIHRLASLEEVEIIGCQYWEEGIRNSCWYWQNLKDHGVKIKVAEL